MYGYIAGISDTNDIKYCPKCAETIGIGRADGSAECGKCGYHFAVIEMESDDDEC